jgi:cell division protein FtsB
MNPNIKRKTNQLQCASLFRWIVLAGFFGVAGLSYVYLKIQLNQSGKQRKRLEQDLRSLEADNDVMGAQIILLKSRPALERRLQEGFIKLAPIDAPSIVMVRQPAIKQWVAADTSGADELHTIAHEQEYQR